MAALQPVRTAQHLYDPLPNGEALAYDPAGVLDDCDAVLAVLTIEQENAWFEAFAAIAGAEDAGTYCEYATQSSAFLVKRKRVTIVADCGGANATLSFVAFCHGQGVPYQSVIGTAECTDRARDEIHTDPRADNHPALLDLLLAIYNPKRSPRP